METGAIRRVRQARRRRATGALGASLSLGVALLMLLTALLAPPTAAADSATIDIVEVNTVNYPEVKITFSATGADGAPIAGLERDALKLYENGQDRALITAYALRNTRTPLSVMLAFDTSGSMADEGKLVQAKAAAKAFIAQMRTIDRLGVVQFDSSFTVAAPFTSDRGTLTRKVDGLTAQGNTRLYDALYLAVNEAARTEGSKAVVLLTDGRDTESVADLGQVLTLARASGIKVYAIAVGAEVDERVLRQITVASGGYYYGAPTAQDITYAFRLMSEQLRNRYEVTYSSPSTAAQGTKMEVRLVADTPDGPVTGLTSYPMPAYMPQIRPAAPVGAQAPVVREASTPAVPEGMIYLSAALLALGILTVCVGLVWSQSLNARHQRLRQFVSTGSQLVVSEEGRSLAAIVTLGAVRLLSVASTRLLSPRHVSRLSHRLLMAGSPFNWRVRSFITVKMVGLLIGGLVGFLLFLQSEQPLQGLLLILALAFLGFYLPNFWLSRRVKARRRSIIRSLPDALDLLTISVEAGLGLDGALLEVVNKWDNALAEEFAIMLAELQLGRNRREALRGLAHRTGVQEIRTFTSALIQADELGMGIARPLALQAQQLRLKRRQYAEKLAHEAAIKMVGVMGVFIMPALFILILSPAILQLQALFKR